MRTLKVGLVALFCLGALSPAISRRVAALSLTQPPRGAAREKSSGAAEAKRQAPGQAREKTVDRSQYVGGESCAECHGAEAAHYALTAHSKTAVGAADA